ncbi:MAG: hypothetical protein MJ025_01540 [Victivallaceae bacterium]|nr:hypothetical protein [Victivallaceae bacterium]
MNRILTIIAAAAAVVIMAGCTSVNTNDVAKEAPVKIEEMVFKPDYSLVGDVSGSAKANCLFGIITWGVNEFADNAFVETNSSSGFPLFKIVDGVTAAKRGATYKACESGKVDYVLGAKYRVDTEDYFVFKKISCTVSGTGAKLNGLTK